MFFPPLENTYMTAANTCLRCGGPLRDDYRHCGRCGTTIYAKEVVAMDLSEGCCAHCGSPIDSDECVWCPFCGKLLLIGLKGVHDVRANTGRQPLPGH